MTDEAPSSPPPGWFPDPKMANTQRYWDGHKWTADVAPVEKPPPASQNQLVGVAILAASVIGLVMTQQSASLLTGTGTQWTGFAIACAAGIAAWVLRASIPSWVRIVAVLAALIAFASVIYLEIQLEERRQDIGEMLDY